VNVLLSVYACEPDKGSEPGVGWQVATAMAGHCRVRAITRANNRAAIEAALPNTPGPHPDFLYYDLPPLLLRLKKSSLLGTSSYYVLWQLAARWHFRKELRGADLIHHVTFNGVQFPGFWIGTGKPVVLGPLGGGMTCPDAMLPLFGKARRKEVIRSWIIRHLHWLPWWKPTLYQADTVIAANRETAELLETHYKGPVPVMLETAVDPAVITAVERPARAGGPLRVLWLGQWEPRKAAVLALQALAVALESEPDIQLVFAGSGPEEARMRAEAEKLGINNSVDFLGRVPKAEVNALMDGADAFLFTSIRDTSGNVVLEAMSRALPVVTVWHQGIREICAPGTALLVEPTTPEETARELAACLVRLKREEGLAARLGTAGRDRLARHFTWQIYQQRMIVIYQQALTGSIEAPES
jgi:glycosyltransferase involved in cell wall biosynthesis